MMRKLLSTIAVVCMVTQLMGQDGLVSAKHDPRIDRNLSPAHNHRINPIYNSNINPSFNWNYNPMETKLINPDSTAVINPLYNMDLNPKKTDLYNPMLNTILHPRNYSWKGRYLFDSTDNLIGFISVASQNILLCFNKEGRWTCYFVRTSNGTYNQFQLTGEWTGKFLCPDSIEGYNLFTKEGVWTGNHVK